MRSIGLYVFVLTFTLTVAMTSAAPVTAFASSKSINVLPWEYSGCVLLILVAVGCAMYRAGVQVPRLVFVILIAFALGWLRMHFVPTHIPPPFTQLLDHKVLLQGTVVRLPDVRETNSHITLKVAEGTSHTNIIAVVPLYPQIQIGDFVTVSGTLKEPAPFSTDGGRMFAYDAFLRKDSVFAIMQPAYATSNGRSTNAWYVFMRALEFLKDFFTHEISQALPEPESALAVGLIVGGKQGLGTRLLDAFTRAGMLQIVVLSGYNVMIVANGILRTLSFMPKRIGISIAAVSVICFVLLAGSGSSAVRAGVMAMLALYARASGKRYDVLRVLAVALFLMVLWNPLLLLYDPGFQFSFLATVGLIIISPLLTVRMLWLKNALIRDMLATTLAAQLGVLPLLLWQTGNLSVVSIVANMLAMPAVPAAMLFSAFAGIVAWPLHALSSPLVVLLGVPAYASLYYIIHMATMSAALPYANVIIPDFPMIDMWAMYAALGVVLLWLYKRTPAHAGPASSSSHAPAV